MFRCVVEMKRLIENIIVSLRNENVKVGWMSNVKNSVFEGKNRIGNNSVMTDSSLARGSYIGDNCHFSGVSIGRYCSIGSNVRVVNGFHPVEKFISTHPAFYSLDKQAGFTYVRNSKYREQRLFDESKKITAKVGNDVWIGNDVVILAGVEIGDGAVVGARALVTHNIESYSIVAGNPARLIRLRFSEEVVNQLKRIAWWDRDEGWIIKNAEKFENSDMFIESCNC